MLDNLVKNSVLYNFQFGFNGTGTCLIIRAQMYLGNLAGTVLLDL